MKNENIKEIPEAPDFFDRVMHLPVLRIFEPFYKKYKEGLLYLFCGGIAFVGNIIIFYALCTTLGMNELIANVIAWICAVIFQFFSNKYWVFKVPTEGTADFVRQFVSFVGSCLFTLLLEEAILYVFITKMSCPSLPVKISAQLIVIIVNYVIRKFILFKHS